MSNDSIVKRLSNVGIFGNIVLAGFKLIAGILGNSGAMISDSVHSLSDVFATLIATVGVRISQKAEDKNHPYGHERFECISSLMLGLILAGTGLGIGYTGINELFFHQEEIKIPTFLPLIAAIVSIIVKEGMFWYTMYYARKLNSDAFKADAWHHRSDAISSVGSFIGIGLAKLGFPFMDPVASLLICILILKVAFDIIKDSLNKMLDTSCDDEFEQSIREYVLSKPGVIRIDVLRTRQFSNRVYVDLEIAVKGDMSLINAHAIAEDVHHGLEHEFSDIKHVMIHVNPYLD
ncbi:cation diffusion facilitator family transporter [Oribacterium sp. WCC10]|uniref:cation diffusion facilitator family transporter n=1 Tax=Oribacterium sp. WCC10 TaxID=1855343 RepID=UPI0008EBFE40|nr:cation diffusion facilitator family transporter [Oribacterium sp. WCC10]SFG21407.1 cation diffusion facilitator family transporter [Oribacterium sp. WCC10]